MDFLAGKKTYIIGIVMVLVGAVKLLFNDLPLDINGPMAIMEGLGFMGLRAGIAKVR